MQIWFLRQWQSFGLAQIVLLPLSWLFDALSSIRRWLYQKQFLASFKLGVPVVVVGNISVGGTGKTPLVIYLAEQLKIAGYRPGIISRGYGGTQFGEVTTESNPILFGDEPVLIAKRSACPVFVNVDRVTAGQDLLAAYPDCNLIISDDGLQHYRLKRDIEIVVVNSKHSLGNQHLLPSGPLREKLNRLATVDAVVDTGRIGLKNIIDTQTLPAIFSMQLNMVGIVSLDEKNKTSLNALKQKNVVAIAGIGHPERFFNFLKGLGLSCEFRAFADHHAFTQHDFADIQHQTILMTEKDAVKCKHLNLSKAWYMPVSAMLNTNEQRGTSLIDLLVPKLQNIKD
ncbi:MAG: tetraacyldisaccharide 4'-kinase [Methylophilus sp.]|jgi:tetraacyldisaccharide 4'-kinase